MPPERHQVLTGTALITGASSGIGAAFARRLGAEGRPLVLVARDESRLQRIAVDLRRAYSVSVEILPADLATALGRELVAARINDPESPIETLINNAGLSLHRGFLDTHDDDEVRLLAVNVEAVLRLSHAAAAMMTRRGRGEIINVSSVAGFGPRGQSATYAASKAWVTSFTESLAMALADTPVRVTALCPGFTRTNFHDASAVPREAIAPSWLWLDADRVAADGMRDNRNGTVISIPSHRYRVLVALGRLLPRPLLRRVLAAR